ncbi:hypothetical protein NDU88_002435 [Pleurodeles waltl]|uniref:Uncharacterized protein n=1 Tax=Pleurodeles waltl TaxID=8319 RepID=A0AAV7WSB8_PLEWA|nr:hypothetical protein NDU88_002435 [Pleurodeles waltl]
MVSAWTGFQEGHGERSDLSNSREGEKEDYQGVRWQSPEERGRSPHQLVPPSDKLAPTSAAGAPGDPMLPSAVLFTPPRPGQTNQGPREGGHRCLQSAKEYCGPPTGLG